MYVTPSFAHEDEIDFGHTYNALRVSVHDSRHLVLCKGFAQVEEGVAPVLHPESWDAINNEGEAVLNRAATSTLFDDEVWGREVCRWEVVVYSISILVDIAKT